MSKSKPLTGIELIDCAKANAKQGAETAANLAGYGQDVETFKTELKQACHRIGVEIRELGDLITEQQAMNQGGGVEVAPDSPSDL